MLTAATNQTEKMLRSFPGRAALTIETGGFVYRRGEDEVFASASVIKLPILLAVLEEARRGQASLADKISLPEMKVGGAGLIEFLHEGAELTLGDLLLFMICLSDNAATNLVVQRFGMERLNGYWTALGLEKTRLHRLMMDVAARRAGRENTTTPAEIHFLLRELARPQAIDAGVARRALGFLTRQQFAAGFGLYLVDEARVAHKTGELEGLFHDVGIIEPGGANPIIYTFFSDRAPNVGESQVVAGKIGRLIYDAWRTMQEGKAE